MADLGNPLLSDRDVEFLLYEVLDAGALCSLPAFAEHSRESFDLYLASARRLARDRLYPAYRALDAAPPRLQDGKVHVHPRLRELVPQVLALGTLAATRPAAVGGAQLPLLVALLADAYLAAANPGAYSYVGLTAGALHLVETFASPALKDLLVEPMSTGRWTGTMALTEPQAGSSLADVTTTARLLPNGRYAVRGAKIFISGGDQDLTENIVHMTLARLEGAPRGVKGISLLAVPKLRPDGGRLVPNDVQVAGLVHKIGWRALPSVILSLGEADGCEGWLVGEPHQGLRYMFQMMNEARLLVGLHGVATASVAYHEALGYAQVRAQGRPLASKQTAGAPQVPIIEHADVRRMLLRQKAIVEGGLSLVATAARFADLAAHATDDDGRRHARLLLDLLTPVAKSFPAEWGFESNALAVQVHGGYGYSSEYLPESWLRDQKLNSIHEGTTGIQGQDLLGRKAVAGGGAALAAFRTELEATLARAERAGVAAADLAALREAVDELTEVTAALGAVGLSGDVEAMLRHSTDYLFAFAIVVVAWQWLAQAAAAREGLAAAPEHRAFYEGKLCAAAYWLATELPRARQLLALCRANEDSYARMRPEWF